MKKDLADEEGPMILDDKDEDDEDGEKTVQPSASNKSAKTTKGSQKGAQSAVPDTGENSPTKSIRDESNNSQNGDKEEVDEAAAKEQ